MFFKDVMEVWMKNTLMYLKRSLYVYFLANIIFPIQSLLVSLSRKFCHLIVIRGRWGLNITVNNYRRIRACSDLQYTFTVSPYVKSAQRWNILSKLIQYWPYSAASCTIFAYTCINNWTGIRFLIYCTITWVNNDVTKLWSATVSVIFRLLLGRKYAQVV